MIFIVGRGRSGTTLLSCLINKNPHISASPEGMFAMHLYSNYSKVKKWNEDKIKQFVDDLLLDTRMSPWNLEKKEIIKELKKSLLDKKDHDYAKICEKIYALYAKSNHKKNSCILIDKNPHYSLCIKKLLKLFPESKFIHIVRDHRDNILSYQNVKFDFDSLEPLAWRWRLFNTEIEKYKSKYKDKFHFLRYEDLISNPKVELHKLCDFLKVKYKESMLDFKDSNNNRFFWDKNVGEPLDPNKINKWEKQMTEKDIFVADYICAEMAKKYNYKITSQAKQLSSLTIIRIKSSKFLAQIRNYLENLIFHFPLRFQLKLINHFRKEFYNNKAKPINKN